MSSRPPTLPEIAAVRDLLRAWAAADVADRYRDNNFERLADELGIWAWFAAWHLADSNWWNESRPGRPRDATGLSGREDSAQFGWFVPQSNEDVFLGVASSAPSVPKTGPTGTKRQTPQTGFDAVMGTHRGRPRDVVAELRDLVPWLETHDQRAMARLPRVPECEAQGFNVRGVRVTDDERNEWFCYEVYPLKEGSWRRDILAVIELDPTVIFVRP